MLDVFALMAKAALLKQQLKDKPCPRCGLLMDPDQDCPHCAHLDDADLQRLLEAKESHLHERQSLGRLFFMIALCLLVFVLLIRLI